MPGFKRGRRRAKSVCLIRRDAPTRSGFFRGWVLLFMKGLDGRPEDVRLGFDGFVSGEGDVQQVRGGVLFAQRRPVGQVQQEIVFAAYCQDGLFDSGDAFVEK